MANRKISDLTALTAPATGDLLPIVDISEAAAADKNKKITLGTLLSGAPLGSAAAPSFAFSGDSNTGIYSPGADQLAIAAGGTGRVFVTSTGVGIGTSIPSSLLHLGAASGTIQMQFNNGGTSSYIGHDSGFTGLDIAAGGGIKFRYYTGTVFAEAAQVDTSGRLLVGTSSNSGGALFQVNGDRVRVGIAKTPASASATGTAGEICWDANYIYVCTATNTWKRTAISTW